MISALPSQIPGISLRACVIVTSLAPIQNQLWVHKQCPQMFPILCFVSQNRFIPFTIGQPSKEKSHDLLMYLSFFLAKGLLSLLSLFFFHTTWYPVFTALDKSFCKVFHKCIQMMGNLGVFEPLVRDEQGLVIQRLEGLCPWLFLWEAVVQSECRINLLGSLDPAMLMKFIQENPCKV